MSDFKQQIEEILVDVQGEDCMYQRHHQCPSNPQIESDCRKCAVDRILAAHNARLDEIADGMPKVEVYGQLGHCAAERELTECRAYIQAQKEGM